MVLTGAGNDFCSGVDFTKASRYMDWGPDEMKKILLGKTHRVALTLEDIDMAKTADKKKEVSAGHYRGHHDCRLGQFRRARCRWRDAYYGPGSSAAGPKQISDRHLSAGAIRSRLVSLLQCGRRYQDMISTPPNTLARRRWVFTRGCDGYHSCIGIVAALALRGNARGICPRDFRNRGNVFHQRV